MTPREKYERLIGLMRQPKLGLSPNRVRHFHRESGAGLFAYANNSLEMYNECMQTVFRHPKVTDSIGKLNQILSDPNVTYESPDGVFNLANTIMCEALTTLRPSALTTPESTMGVHPIIVGDHWIICDLPSTLKRHKGTATTVIALELKNAICYSCMSSNNRIICTEDVGVDGEYNMHVSLTMNYFSRIVSDGYAPEHTKAADEEMESIHSDFLKISDMDTDGTLLSPGKIPSWFIGRCVEYIAKYGVPTKCNANGLLYVRSPGKTNTSMAFYDTTGRLYLYDIPVDTPYPEDFFLDPYIHDVSHIK